MATRLWLRCAITLAYTAALTVGSTLPAAAAGLPARQNSNPLPLEQTAGDYVPISDRSGILSVEVPETWSDVEETEWTMADEAVGTKLTAAPNLEDFYDSWSVPGVMLSYSESLPQEMTAEELLATIDYSAVCEASDPEEVTDGRLIGVYQIWANCDDTTTAAIAALGPADSSDYYILVEIYAVEEEDLDALDHILETLAVGGDVDKQNPTATTTTDSALLDSIDTSKLEYTYVELRSPAIVALVPERYAEVESAVWENSDGEPLGLTLTAAPDIQDFHDTWTTPGMIVKSAVDLTEALDADEMLADGSLAEYCIYDDRYPDERTTDGGVTYIVDYDWYTNCGETESSYVVGLAQSDLPGEAIFFDFLIVDAADEEAFDVFLQSFSLDRERLTVATAAATADAGVEHATNDETSGDGKQRPVFIDITDDSETISLRVPESWSDTLSDDWDLGNGPIGSAFSAAPDLQGFNGTWDVPGVFVGVSEDVAASFAPAEALDVFDFSDNCTYVDRYDYESASLEGIYDVWVDCGDIAGGTFVVLAANPADKESPLVLLYINMPAEDDTAVFGELVETLTITGAVTPVDDAQEEEEPLAQPLAVIKVDSLNIRSGPGTNYNRVGVASQGDALTVEGKVDSCDWLKITSPDGVGGWASGKDQYVTLDTRCTDIPDAKRPAPPAETPASPEGGARSDQGSSQSGSVATGSSQGCYRFQNGLGSELTVTFTRTETGKGTTFKVAGKGEMDKCFDPGRYTYTIDAPPPWNSINGELTVQAGDTFLFPISGQ
jgi:hypothetical protein